MCFCAKLSVLGFLRLLFRTPNRFPSPLQRSAANRLLRRINFGAQGNAKRFRQVARYFSLFFHKRFVQTQLFRNRLPPKVKRVARCSEFLRLFSLAFSVIFALQLASRFFSRVAY